MAKETKNEALDFSNYDFDSEFNYDIFQDQASDEPKGREPSRSKTAKKFAKATSKNFAAGLKDRTITNVMPRGFNRDVNKINRMGRNTKSLFKDVIKEGKEIARENLPKSMYERLGIKDGQQPDQIVRRADAAAQREANIQNNLKSIFDKQSKIEENITKGVEFRMEGEGLNLNRVQVGFLERISDRIEGIYGYTVQITNDFYRKSLELQFKSYYTQMDILKTMTNYYQGFAGQFDRIVHNTSLPESVKITQSDRMTDRFKSGLADRVYNSAWRKDGYLDRLQEKARRRILGRMKDFRYNAAMAREMRHSANEMGMSDRDLAIEAGGGFAADYLNDKLDDRFAGRMRRFGQNNKIVRNIGNAVSMIANNPEYLIGKAREKARARQTAAYRKDSVGGRMGSKFWGMLDTALSIGDLERRDLRVKRDEFGDFSKGANFDMNVYRSITEGIPMQLSKIALSTANLSAMYYDINSAKFSDKLKLKTEELMYNIFDRKLTTRAEYQKSASNKFNESKYLNQPHDKVALGLKNEAIEQLKKNKVKNAGLITTLNKTETSEILTDYVRFMERNKNVDSSFEGLFIDTLGNDIQPEVKDYLDERPELVKIIRAISKSTESEDGKKRVKDRYDREIEYLGSPYPVDVVKKTLIGLHELAGLGSDYLISDKQAEIIAKILTLHIQKTNKALQPTVDNIKEAFNDYEEADEKYIKEPFNTMIFCLRKIATSGSGTTKFSLNKLFAALNTAIVEKSFTLRDGVSDEFVTSMNELKNLPGNLLDGKETMNILDTIQLDLNRDDNVPRGNSDDLLEDKNKYDSDKTRYDSAGSFFDRIDQGWDKIKNTGERIKENYQDDESMIGSKRVKISELYDRFKVRLSKGFDILVKGLQDIGKYGQKIGNENKGKIIGYLKAKLENSEKDIERVKTFMAEIYGAFISKINEIRGQGDADVEKTANSTESFITKLNNKRIEMFSELLDKIRMLREWLERTRYGDTPTGEFLKNLRSRIGELLEQLHNLVKFSKSENL